MPETRIGKAIHEALEKILTGMPMELAIEAARKPLLDDIENTRFDNLAQNLPAFVSRIGQFRQRKQVQKELVEHSLAIRENFTSTAFFAGDAFYRGVIDVGYLFEDGQSAVVDHKSGVRDRRLSIIEQLEGYAVLACAQFRSTRRLWLGVHWILHSDMEWAQPMLSSDIRHTLVPKLLGNIEAAALAVSDGPRPNQGVWCERCSYRSVCPAGREFRFEPADQPSENEEDF